MAYDNLGQQHDTAADAERSNQNRGYNADGSSNAGGGFVGGASGGMAGLVVGLIFIAVAGMLFYAGIRQYAFYVIPPMLLLLWTNIGLRLFGAYTDKRVYIPTLIIIAGGVVSALFGMFIYYPNIVEPSPFEADYIVSEAALHPGRNGSGRATPLAVGEKVTVNGISRDREEFKITTAQRLKGWVPAAAFPEDANLPPDDTWSVIKHVIPFFGGQEGFYRDYYPAENARLDRDQTKAFPYNFPYDAEMTKSWVVRHTWNGFFGDTTNMPDNLKLGDVITVLAYLGVEEEIVLTGSKKIVVTRSKHDYAPRFLVKYDQHGGSYGVLTNTHFETAAMKAERAAAMSPVDRRILEFQGDGWNAITLEELKLYKDYERYGNFSADNEVLTTIPKGEIVYYNGSNYREGPTAYVDYNGFTGYTQGGKLKKTVAPAANQSQSGGGASAIPAATPAASQSQSGAAAPQTPAQRFAVGDTVFAEGYRYIYYATITALRDNGTADVRFYDNDTASSARVWAAQDIIKTHKAEGNPYEGKKGDCEVLALEGGEMRVRFTGTGAEETLPLESVVFKRQ
jgi:hypothetical protein